MNSYTDYKVYIFGSWIKDGHNEIMPYMGSWSELLKLEEFTEFRKKHEITDKQLAIVKRGFHGWPIEGLIEGFPEEKTKEDDYDFPFGTHKDKKFSEVPDAYYMFLLDQPWIQKWPAVLMYAKEVNKRLNKNAATPEEIKEILGKININ